MRTITAFKMHINIVLKRLKEWLKTILESE